MADDKEQMAGLGSLRRHEDLFIAGVFAAGAICFTLSFAASPGPDWFGLATIVILTAAVERFATRLYFDGRVSISFVGTVIAGLLFGPTGSALTVVVVWLVPGWPSRGSLRKALFNFGHLSIAACLAAAVPYLAGWTGDTDPWHMLIAGSVGASIVFAVSSLAVAAIMSIVSGRRFGATYRENFTWLLPHYAGLGLVAGGLATLYGEVGVLSVLVVAVPLLLSRYAMDQVVERTRDNVIRLERSNNELQHAYVEIRDMSEQLRDAYTGTLESLVTALDVRDQETRGHSVRVATHSVDIAKMLGITAEEDLAFVYRGALMHDVGKIGVPDAILLKPGKLTEEEWEFMRKHSALGYRILAQVPYLRPAAKIVLAHHERWDGAGYPRRLKGEDIPLGARIFALADTYDAIISDRPYRQGQTPEAAFAEILRCAGSQFDPKVVEAFEALFPQWATERPGDSRMLQLPASRPAARKAG